LIEFTLSRVSMMICGMILLTAILVPVSNAYESMEDENLYDVSADISAMMDSFWDSKADIMYLRGWEILPDPECGLVFEKNYVILTKDGNEYRSLMQHPSERITMSYNDVLEIERFEDTIRIAYQ
jgi:hypothetical protein